MSFQLCLARLKIEKSLLRNGFESVMLMLIRKERGKSTHRIYKEFDFEAGILNINLLINGFVKLEKQIRRTTIGCMNKK